MMKRIQLGRIGTKRVTALFLACSVAVACSGKEEGDDGPSGGDGPAGIGGQTSQVGTGGTGGTFDGGDGDGDGDVQNGDGDGLNQGALSENCSGEEPSEGASCGE